MRLFRLNPESFLRICRSREATFQVFGLVNETQSYVSDPLMKLSTVGALFLGVVALIPLIAQNLWNLDESIGLGGTSLLIVVGVAIETIRQIRGLMMKREMLDLFMIHDQLKIRNSNLIHFKRGGNNMSLNLILMGLPGAGRYEYNLLLISIMFLIFLLAICSETLFQIARHSELKLRSSLIKVTWFLMKLQTESLKND